MKSFIEILIIILVIIIAILLVQTILKGKLNILGGRGKKYEPESYILVYCHNKPIPPDIRVNGTKIIEDRKHLHWDHFLMDFFNQKITEKKLEKMQTETLDILPIKYIMHPPLTFPYIHNQDDGFDVDSTDSFINTHLNIYDIVFMPDCGGPWFKALKSSNSPAELAKIINNVMKIVKKDGWLFVGKLMDNEDKTLDILQNVYNWKNSIIITYPYESIYLKFIHVINS